MSGKVENSRGFLLLVVDLPWLLMLIVIVVGLLVLYPVDHYHMPNSVVLPEDRHSLHKLFTKQTTC